MLERKFRQSLEYGDAPSEVKIKQKLSWRPIDFLTARAKYGFKIYSMRVGAVANYALGISEPRNGFWTEIVNPPNGSGFEEASDLEFEYVRILKFGVPERNGLMKRDKKR